MTQVFIVRNGKKLKRFTDVIGLSITYNGNGVPTCNITMDLRVLPYLTRKCELIIVHGGETIRLMARASDITVKNKTVAITTEHVFIEWSDESVPVNVAVKNKTIKELLKSNDFNVLKHKWRIEYDNSKELRDFVDYEFSRERKDEALEKMLTQTETLLKRFPRNRNRVLQIGTFGEKKQFRVPIETAINDISMEMDSSAICNMVVPIADKGDGGASALTLRDSFLSRYGERTMFPIVLTGAVINTQATRTSYDFPQYAPNNTGEYAIMDIKGIEMEDGDIYENTFTTNDMQPIQEEGKSLSNADRLITSEKLRKSGIRYLKNHRRQMRFTVPLSEFPRDIDVLDRVKFNVLMVFPTITEGMTPYEEEIYGVDDWFYVTEITMTANQDDWQYQVILSKDLSGVYGNGVN